jgi:uncharacterized protein YlaI
MNRTTTNPTARRMKWTRATSLILHGALPRSIFLLLTGRITIPLCGLFSFHARTGLPKKPIRTFLQPRCHNRTKSVTKLNKIYQGKSNNFYHKKARHILDRRHQPPRRARRELAAERRELSLVRRFPSPAGSGRTVRDNNPVAAIPLGLIEGIIGQVITSCGSSPGFGQTVAAPRLTVTTGATGDAS